jgi:hypothetical protein
MFGRPRRFAPLAEGRFAFSDAKAVVCVPGDRPEEVAVVLDSTRAERTIAECAGATREPGPTATDPVRLGARPQAGALAAFRRDHAPAA